MSRGRQEAAGRQSGDRRHAQKGERLFSAEVFRHPGNFPEVTTFDAACQTLKRTAHLPGISAERPLIRLFQLAADFLKGGRDAAKLACRQLFLVLGDPADSLLGFFRLLIGKLAEFIQILPHGLLQGTVRGALAFP